MAKAMRHAPPKVVVKKTAMVTRLKVPKAKAMKAKAPILPVVAPPPPPEPLSGEELQLARARSTARQFGEVLRELVKGLSPMQVQDVMSELSFSYCHEKVYLKPSA